MSFSGGERNRKVLEREVLNWDNSILFGQVSEGKI